jgi:DNA repair exonuclease SbcCD ATPase subunit
MSQPAAASTGSERRTIGDILLAHGYVTERQLDDAAETQQRTGKPLGQVLVEAGAITRLELASALAEQWSDSSDWMIAPRDEEPGADDGDPARSIGLAAPRRPSDDALLSRITALEAAVQEVLRSDVEATTSPLEHAVSDLARRITTWEPTLAELERRTDAAVDAEALETELSELNEQLARTLHRAETTDGALAELSGQLESIRSSLGDVAATRIDELARQIGELREHVERSAADAHAELAASAARLESRIEQAVTDGIGTIDPGELQARLDEVASRPAADPELPERLAALASRFEELAARPQQEELAGRIEAIAARLPLFADGAALEDLREQIAEIAARPHDVAGRLDDLARRVDALVVEAGARVEGDVPAELRAAIEELAARPPVDAALAARVEELGQRVAELPSAHTVAEVRDTVQRLASDRGDGELAARMDELASRIADLPYAEELRALRQTVAELSERPAGDPTAMERVWHLTERIDALADDVSRVDAQGLRARIDALADRPRADSDVAERVSAATGQLDELAQRVAELEAAGSTAESWARPGDLDAIRAALAETAASAAAQLDEVGRRVAELEQAGHALPPGAAPTVNGALPAGLDERLSKLDKAAAELSGELSRTSELWYAGRAALEERLEKLEARVAKTAAQPAPVVPPGSVVHAPVPHMIEQEVERVLMAVERLGLHLSEHDRALAELMSRRGSSKVEELEARLDELETYGVAAAPAAGGDGSTPVLVQTGDTRDLRAEIRALTRQLSELEDTTRTDREKTLTQLERMASSIDWRIRRIESGETAG